MKKMHNVIRLSWSAESRKSPQNLPDKNIKRDRQIKFTQGGPSLPHPGAVFALFVLLLLSPAIAQDPVAEITSPGTAEGAVGEAFSYQGTSQANVYPTAWRVIDPLPPGLKVSWSGRISGTPTEAGMFAARLQFSSSIGLAQKVILFTIAGTPPVPSVTSTPVVDAQVGVPFSYQATASGGAIRWSSPNLVPRGLVFLGNGQILGTPQIPGVYVMQLSVQTSAGSAMKRLIIRINAEDPTPTLEITSPTTMAGSVGTPFRFEAMSEPPASSWQFFGQWPNGTSPNPSTGVLAGTPQSAGVYTFRLQAFLDGETVDKNVTITIAAPEPAVPVITSPSQASAEVGVPFRYVLTADHAPERFDVYGVLTPGLTFSGDTISGTPTEPGTAWLFLRAQNATGADLAPLTITVDDNVGVSLPIAEEFSSGALPVAGSGWVLNRDDGGVQDARSGYLYQYASGTGYALNEAILHVDPASDLDCILEFSVWNNRDEPDFMPLEFDGSVNADGVAISVDGSRWYRVFDPNFQGYRWADVAIDLGSVATYYELEVSDHLYIKFQQYDDQSQFGADGIAWDNIRVNRGEVAP